MRFLLPLVALCALSSAALRASDIFYITLTGNTGSVSGNGTFTTDGICVDCFAPPSGTGILSLTINIGANNGPDAFDISDDASDAVYDRAANGLFYMATNSETGDQLVMGPTFSTWDLRDAAGFITDSGTYSVAPAPEPRSLFLLMPVVAIVGLRWRKLKRM